MNTTRVALECYFARTLFKYFLTIMSMRNYLLINKLSGKLITSKKKTENSRGQSSAFLKLVTISPSLLEHWRLG